MPSSETTKLNIPKIRCACYAIIPTIAWCFLFSSPSSNLYATDTAINTHIQGMLTEYLLGIFLKF